MYRPRILHRYVVHDLLACDSPRTLVELLQKHLASPDSNDLVRPLDILDVAAGNGIVGAELRKQLTANPGIKTLIGTDLLESARSAAMRDRPDVYDDYVTADLTRPQESQLPSSSDVVVMLWVPAILICRLRLWMEPSSFCGKAGCLRLLSMRQINELETRLDGKVSWRVLMGTVDVTGNVWRRLHSKGIYIG